MKIPVYSTDGKETGKFEIAGQWKEMPLARQAIKDAVVYYRASARRGTAQAKDRSEIKASTRKPWRQKGTGRARIGTVSSPLWRKGGVVFGPKSRDFSIKLPKKVRRLALRSVLGDKIKNNEVIIVDKIEMDKPKTKIVVNWMRNLKSGIKSLIVMKDANKNVKLSVRNIPGVEFSRAGDLNTYIVLAHRKLVVEKEAWKTLEERLLGQERKPQRTQSMTKDKK